MVQKNDLEQLFEEIKTTSDPLENAIIWKVRINPGEPQHGHLEYENRGMGTALFVWNGDQKIADELYLDVQSAIDAFSSSCAKYYDLWYCDKHNVYRADIRLNDALTKPQKYRIAKGIETQGHTIEVKKY